MNDRDEMEAKTTEVSIALSLFMQKLVDLFKFLSADDNIDSAIKEINYKNKRREFNDQRDFLSEAHSIYRKESAISPDSRHIEALINEMKRRDGRIM